MKKFAATVLILFLLTPLAYAQAPDDLSARSAVLIDSASGRLLYEKNGFERLPMASTTKIMTAVLTLENLPLTAKVRVSPVAAGVEGSSIWLETGEELTVEEMLYGLMLNSGNDAAVALAEAVAGSVDAFVTLMNARARELGLFNTSFETPNGLDGDGHYTTAFDLAALTRHALTLPRFREIVGTKQKTIPWAGHEWDRSLKNHNKLLWRYEGCTGVKTGYTKKAGRCLVSSAVRGGRELIAVTLNAPSDWEDHAKLLDHGFEDFEAVPLTSKGQLWETITLDSEEIGLVCASDFTSSLRAEELAGIEYRTEAGDFSLPIKKGQTLARLYIFCQGEYLGGVDLLADRSLERNGFFDILKKIAKELM